MRLRHLAIQLLAALLVIGGAIGVESAWPQRSQFAYETVEQAVRAQVGKPVGRLTREELGKVTSLQVQDGLIQDLTWVSALPNLSDLDVSGNPIRDLSPLAGLPSLNRLNLGGTAATDLSVLEKLPALSHLILAGDGSQVYRSASFRVDMAQGVFLGDSGMSIPALLEYGTYFEAVVLPEEQRDLGLAPSPAGKPVFYIYGSEDEWRKAAERPDSWGYYSATARQVVMAHWRGERMNKVLLAHEYSHLLVFEVGRLTTLTAPLWFHEGLAHNVAWRIAREAEGWDNPFTQERWAAVAASQEPVPVLAEHKTQDDFMITAMTHLLQTRGRGRLQEFIRVARSGKRFPTAFETAFGVTPEAYQQEYEAEVRRRRTGQ